MIMPIGLTEISPLFARALLTFTTQNDERNRGFAEIGRAIVRRDDSDQRGGSGRNAFEFVRFVGAGSVSSAPHRKRQDRDASKFRV
jgi:hypothetical protein